MEKCSKLFFLAILLINLGGCRKDKELFPGEHLPFSNGIFSLELISTNLPEETIDVNFFDRNEVIALTFDGKIFKTLDAGNTWKLTYSMSGFPPFVESLFITEDIGFVVGGKSLCFGTGCIPPGGIVLRTVDRGENWSVVNYVPNGETLAIEINDHGELFVISNSTAYTISKSSDQGQTWEIVDSIPFVMQDISFHENRGYVIGEDGNVAISQDYGVSWETSQEFDALYGTELDIAGDVGYCIQNLRQVYVSNDYGNNWIPAEVSGNRSYVILDISPELCLIFGAGRYSGGDYGSYWGGVKYTTDSGISWKEHEFNDLGVITGASLYHENYGYLVSGSKLIHLTIF
ncbi:MAG: hypothetical protein R2780_14185 [Crocinitomicaceae bacterium]